jgi:hypothetical protein
MKDSDETAFINGTADRSLRTAYGLPEDMDAATASKIFRHFCALPGAYSIVDQRTDHAVIKPLVDQRAVRPDRVHDHGKQDFQRPVIFHLWEKLLLYIVGQATDDLHLCYSHNYYLRNALPRRLNRGSMICFRS